MVSITASYRFVAVFSRQPKKQENYLYSYDQAILVLVPVHLKSLDSDSEDEKARFTEGFGFRV